LREMQRLLGETWRYQQLEDVVGSPDARAYDAHASYMDAGQMLSLRAQTPPVQFSHTSDRLCEPPPICMDLVEVRAAQAAGQQTLCGAQAITAQTASNACMDGGESLAADEQYVFLGRLVATLPGMEAQALGPNAPKAVVECNFWERRETSAIGSEQHPGNRQAPCLELDRAVASSADRYARRQIGQQQVGTYPVSPVVSARGLGLFNYSSRESEPPTTQTRSSAAAGAELRTPSQNLEDDGRPVQRRLYEPAQKRPSVASILGPPAPPRSSTGMLKSWDSDEEDEEELPPWPHEM